MIIVIIIVAFLAFLFLRDKNDEVKKVQMAGGMQEKYRILIDHFRSIPNMKVQSNRTTSITMAVTDRFVETKFIISQGFDAVSVSWFHTSIRFGSHELHWKFPETMTQNLIITLIEDELRVVESKLMSGIIV